MNPHMRPRPSRRTFHSAAFGLALAALVTPALPARAQDNAAAVEALFSAGKKLMADGKVAEACPKFLASYNLEHRIGTVLNLADCYEKNGQLASAWARFVEARTLAQRASQPERATFAGDHAKALEPRLSTLSVTVTAPPPGLKVTQDGVAVDAGAFGVAVAIDGGKYDVSASAPGMRTWTGQVTVQTSGDHQTLAIPALEAAPVVAVAGTEHASPTSTRTYAAIGLAGAGVVAGGLGVVFGIVAITKNHDSNTGGCGVNGVADDCNAAGLALRNAAVSDGTLSTVLIGVGAAAVVGGAVLWLTGRSASSTTVGFDGRSLVVGGTF